MTATRRPWHRKRRHLGLLIIALCYAMIFVYEVGQDNGKPETPTDGVARDITCERRWFFLGASHVCRAVVHYEGKEYPNIFTYELGMDDVGQEVPVTRTGKYKKSQTPMFTTAPARTGVPMFVIPLVWFALGSTNVFLLIRIMLLTAPSQRPKSKTRID
ncbi:hypothetical protein GCM10022243_15250 [Saccharothrix violaceirubra]|uniref:Uncharacterized protein n=1 Tax=Saccharothrix violaceirubra TaxID=413306 RepID=A0A7W7T6C6_9PSEU|nr:hypothetical protein [Saccharothrix violaceirubra]MBB4967401.1 hypothetical protein [Saccharothrix violaceirubra]